ncbi:putative nuclease HARBI1 [Spea bombifrons]|uniref:putative nuclease HARBI1 n=1 Tax=Spea bombifrons TaxID=233779 RepID=UPI00234BBFCD|nr:putative nuclease HARBI1 [Spea bombifrons]
MSDVNPEAMTENTPASQSTPVTRPLARRRRAPRDEIHGETLNNSSRGRIPRVFQPRTILERLSDQQILKRFRLSREAIMDLYQHISQDLEPLTSRSHAIPGLVKLLAVLNYFGKYSYQTETGYVVGISQPSFSRCLTQVLRALVARAKDFLHFPRQDADWVELQLAFHSMAGMPKVLGVIDCTQVAIRRPAVRGEQFRNHKRFYSLNTQVVCDARQRIMSVRSGFPGSCEDDYILCQSALYDNFENGQMPDGWLLGDSAYGCRPWLLTPVLNPRTAPEHSYNEAHKTTHLVVTRTFGALKSRFKCLSNLLCNPDTASHIIVSCCMLHNLAIRHQVPLNRQDELVPEETVLPDVYMDSEDEGMEVREQLITTNFSGTAKASKETPCKE